ncbi:MAG TPA: UbiA family prenyltransferase [Gemmatimonadaceae bacterium]
MRARWRERMRVAVALAQLARWPNALIAAGAVGVGAWWVGWGPARPIALAALAALPLTAAANAWNDLADVAIDRRAHPERPLPSGRASGRIARRFASLAALAGVALASAARPALGALSVGVVALMRAYSPWLKRGGIAGNAIVSVLASLPFLYGGWAAGDWRGAIPLVAIAAPLHLAREIAKDLEDAPADAGERRTLPVAAGPAAAVVALAAAVTVFFALATPYAMARPRFAIAMVPAALLIARGVLSAARGRRGGPGALKLAMVCAMAALLLARP